MCSILFFENHMFVFRCCVMSSSPICVRAPWQTNYNRRELAISAEV